MVTTVGLEKRSVVAGSLESVPFDAMRLDRLLEDAGLDAILVTSKHNIQYMLGGYRYFFYANMDAHGLSRYLPCLVYVKGRAHETTYVGSPMEDHERELGKFWVRNTHFSNMTSGETAATAVATLRRLAPRARRIGIEMSFLPVDAFEILRDSLPEATFASATLPLELLRAVKTATELRTLEDASTKVVEAMLATIARTGVGSTKAEVAEALRVEESARGVNFDYCLVAVGTSFNRAPSGQEWRDGDVLSLDSGGNIGGYIGDLCRMAIAGEPDTELEDLLAEIDVVQMAARRPVRAGTRGGDVLAGPEELLARSTHRDRLDFVAHGMGIVSHEAPWLTSRSAVPYEAYHADRPLEAGMVLSIETTLLHPRRGLIKLEDTVAVTETGWTAFGDAGRGWNRAGI